MRHVKNGVLAGTKKVRFSYPFRLPERSTSTQSEVIRLMRSDHSHQLRTVQLPVKQNT